jgi:hypothetical protein
MAQCHNGRSAHISDNSKGQFLYLFMFNSACAVIPIPLTEVFCRLPDLQLRGYDSIAFCLAFYGGVGAASADTGHSIRIPLTSTDERCPRSRSC